MKKTVLYVLLSTILGVGFTVAIPVAWCFDLEREQEECKQECDNGTFGAYCAARHYPCEWFDQQLEE